MTKKPTRYNAVIKVGENEVELPADGFIMVREKELDLLEMRYGHLLEGLRFYSDEDSYDEQGRPFIAGGYVGGATVEGLDRGHTARHYLLSAGEKPHD